MPTRVFTVVSTSSQHKYRLSKLWRITAMFTLLNRVSRTASTGQPHRQLLLRLGANLARVGVHSSGQYRPSNEEMTRANATLRSIGQAKSHDLGSLAEEVPSSRKAKCREPGETLRFNLYLPDQATAGPNRYFRSPALNSFMCLICQSIESSRKP